MTNNSKRIFKIFGLLALAGLLIGSVVAYKMWTKPHKDVAAAEALNLSAQNLVSDYETDEAAANGKYLNKVLLVNGVVAETTTNQAGETVIAITGSDMGNVLCTLEEKGITAPAKGTEVKIKGICTGYLTDVVLVRSILEK